MATREYINLEMWKAADGINTYSALLSSLVIILSQKRWHNNDKLICKYQQDNNPPTPHGWTMCITDEIIMIIKPSKTTLALYRIICFRCENNFASSLPENVVIKRDTLSQ